MHGCWQRSVTDVSHGTDEVVVNAIRLPGAWGPQTLLFTKPQDLVRRALSGDGRGRRKGGLQMEPRLRALVASRRVGALVESEWREEDRGQRR